MARPCGQAGDCGQEISQRAPYGKLRNHRVRRPHPPRFRKSRLEHSAEGGTKKKRKNFKELLYNSNGRPGCSQTLSDLSEAAIKNPKDGLTTITLYKLLKTNTIKLQ